VTVCPGCGEARAPSASVCTHCGDARPVVATSPPGSGAAEIEYVCPGCDRTVAATDARCPSCGQEFDLSVEGREVPAPTRRPGPRTMLDALASARPDTQAPPAAIRPAPRPGTPPRRRAPTAAKGASWMMVTAVLGSAVAMAVGGDGGLVLAVVMLIVWLAALLAGLVGLVQSVARRSGAGIVLSLVPFAPLLAALLVIAAAD
jgi:hypothetical protein